MDAIVQLWTLLFSYGRYCLAMDAIVYLWALLFSYGRYCLAMDAIVQLWTLLFSYGAIILLWTLLFSYEYVSRCSILSQTLLSLISLHVHCTLYIGVPQGYAGVPYGYIGYVRFTTGLYRGTTYYLPCNNRRIVSFCFLDFLMLYIIAIYPNLLYIGWVSLIYFDQQYVGYVRFTTG